MRLFDSIGKALKCDAQKEAVLSLIDDCNKAVKKLNEYKNNYEYNPIIKQNSKTDFSYCLNEPMGIKVDFNIHNYDSLFMADKWINNKIDLINNEIEKIKEELESEKDEEYALER